MDTQLFCPFQVGEKYTRRDVYEIMQVPEEKRRGNWETGYNQFGDDLFIFPIVGAPATGGYDYNNHWDGDEFVWYAKEGTRLRQPQIQWMLHPTGKVFLFTRDTVRQPFTFHGLATAVAWEDTSPVMIRWRIHKPNGPDSQLTPPSKVPQLSEEQENDYAIENRKVEIKQRVKQSLFCQRVLANFDSRCCISGITEPELLIASHIIPWAKRVDCRLDPANGLCLSVLYDQLFDEGFITFDDELRVIITPYTATLSGRLQQELRAIEGKRAFQSLTVAIKPEYLAYHRENVFRAGENTSGVP